MTDLIDWETLAFDRHYAAEQELTARIAALEADAAKWKQTSRLWEKRAKDHRCGTEEGTP